MVACAIPVSASATDVTLTMTTDKDDFKSGETVTVNVILSENSKINCFTVDLVYDNSKLELLSHSTYDIGGTEIVANPSYRENKIRLILATATPIEKGGVVLSVRFTTLASSCNTISLDVLEAAKATGSVLNNIEIATTPLTIHSYGEWITVKEPACETIGEKSKSCSCGNKITDIIGVLGHDYSTEFTVDSEPNCTDAGSKSQHCSRCESKQNVTEIPVLEHNYVGEVTKVPTHTENGEMTFTCGGCSHAYTEVIEADGTHKHIPSVTTEPTCTEKGVMTYTCVCGNYYTEDIPANGHTSAAAVEENYIAPNCTDKGSKDLVVYCSVCKKELSRKTETISATGHNYSNGSCTKCGEKDPDYYSFAISEPSRTSIRNKDGIILHANVEGNRPAGSYVKWTANNGNFKSSEMNNGDSFKVIAENNGKTIFTATLYGADGKALATDTVELNSKSGFFDKIGGFFRSLFGTTKVYEN